MNGKISTAFVNLWNDVIKMLNEFDCLAEGLNWPGRLLLYSLAGWFLAFHWLFGALIIFTLVLFKRG